MNINDIGPDCLFEVFKHIWPYEATLRTVCKQWRFALIKAVAADSTLVENNKNNIQKIEPKPLVLIIINTNNSIEQHLAGLLATGGQGCVQARRLYFFLKNIQARFREYAFGNSDKRYFHITINDYIRNYFIAYIMWAIRADNSLKIVEENMKKYDFSHINYTIKKRRDINGFSYKKDGRSGEIYVDLIYNKNGEGYIIRGMTIITIAEIFELYRIKKEFYGNPLKYNEKIPIKIIMEEPAAAFELFKKWDDRCFNNKKQKIENNENKIILTLVELSDSPESWIEFKKLLLSS